MCVSRDSCVSDIVSHNCCLICGDCCMFQEVFLSAKWGICVCVECSIFAVFGG